MAAEIRENKCVVLKTRPGVESQPNDSNFALEKREVPPCNEGEILVKTLYLSVDPYMRCRMNEETGSSYLTPWPLGDPPTGGGVGQVIQSKSQNFKEGDIVESIVWPWQELVVFSGENPRLVKVYRLLTQKRMGHLRFYPHTAYGRHNFDRLSFEWPLWKAEFRYSTFRAKFPPVVVVVMVGGMGEGI